METIRTQLIQKALLRAYEWFELVADKHGIEYVLDAGCLLGAVRNGKFVPWDDDMDITISRREFVRLEEILKNTPCPPEIELHLPGSMHQSNVNPYSIKIRLKGLSGEEPNLLKRGLSDNSRANSAPSLDIVALDHVSDTGVKSKVLIKIARLASSMVRLRHASLPLRPEVENKYKFAIFLVRALPRPLLSKAKQLFAYLQSRPETPFVCYSLGDNYPNCIWRESDYFPPTMIRFEGKLVPAPNKPNVILEALYGPDFLTPPTAENQKSHFSKLTLDPKEDSYLHD